MSQTAIVVAFVLLGLLVVRGMVRSMLDKNHTQHRRRAWRLDDHNTRPASSGDGSSGGG
jgi:hypothetical protein